MRDLNLRTSRVTIEYQHENWDFEVPMDIDFSPAPLFLRMFIPTAKDGCKILVGLNGTGKTTLLKVIEDFYSTFGEISGTYSVKLSAMISKWKTKRVQFFRSTMYFDISELNNWNAPIQVGHSDNVIREKIRMEYYFNILQAHGNELELNFPQYLDRLDDLEFEKGIVEWGHEIMVREYPIDNLELQLKLISEIDLKSNTTVSYIEADFSTEPYEEGHECSVNISREFEGTPFGPRNFHKTMIEILTEIGNDTGLEFSIERDFSFKSPSIKPVYISALETSEKATMINEKLFDCIKDFNAIEEVLAKKSKEELWDVFGIEPNKEQLRTYSEWKYADCGSNEYFEVKGGVLIFEDGGANMKRVVDKEIISNFTRATVVHPSLFAYANPPSVHGPKEVYQCTLLEERGGRVHRWQDAVIHCEGSGLIYSKSDSALEEYLKRDLWCEIGLQNKIILLSRIFDVKREELTALFALNELSPDFNNYLTSGQSRVFSMIEKAAKSNCDFLLIDEPEVSLHIDWQRKIIDLVKKYTGAKYILAATHSPDIIYHHLTKVVELNSAIDD